MRRSLAGVALAALVVLAGCQAATYHGGMTVEVRSVEATDDGYTAAITLTTWGEIGDNSFPSPTVVGYDARGDPVCSVEFDGALKTGLLSGSKRAALDCEAFPVVFAPSDTLVDPAPSPSPATTTPGDATPTGTPTWTPTPYAGDGMHRYVVDHHAAVYVGRNESGFRYETTGEPALPTARCRQRVRNANVSVIDGPTPWMDWTLRDPEVDRRYRLEVGQATETYADTETEFDDPNVDPVRMRLPDGERAAALRDALDAARRKESWQTVERSVTREAFLETAELVLMQPVVEMDDVPTGSAVPDHATARRSDETRIDCPEGHYDGDEELSVTAVVRTRGDYWKVTLTYAEVWSGPAFDRS